MLKICNKCKVQKELSEYFNDKSSKDGKYSLCKECKLNGTKIWRKNSPEKYNAQMRRYNAKHRYRIHLKRDYNLIPEDYDKIYLEQKGKCKICAKSSGKRRFVIDHDHTTKQIRGLLCYNCNRGMHYMDNENWVIEATKYKKLL